MTKDEVIDALGKQKAYDHGATDSGVNDQVRTKQTVEWLMVDATDKEFNDILVEFCRIYSTPPYGYEDLLETVKWLVDLGLEP